MAAESSFTPGGSRHSRLGLLSEPRIRPCYVSIPKKQQKLLDRDDAWLGNLGGASHRFVNVPPEVLEDVKASHARQQAPERQKSSSPPQYRTPAVQRTPVQQPRLSVEYSSRHQSQISPSPVVSVVSQKNEKEVPWSSSPSEHLRTPEAGRQSDKETDTQTTPSKGGTSPSRPIRDATRSRFLTDFPSSAVDEDADLELEEPGVLRQQPNPVNKLASLVTKVPTPTPPSAQLPVIPGSYTYVSSRQKTPRAARSGLMKRLKFPDSKHKVPVIRPDHTRLQPEITRLQHTNSAAATFAPSGNDVSRKPAAIPILATGTPTLVPPSYESSRIPETSPFQRRPTSSPQVSDTVDTRVIEESSLEVQEEFHSQPLDKETIEESTFGSPPSSDASTPWDIYKKTYPDFSGTIGDFVRACLCVQDLQRKKALPVFLYDDFIRAFAKDYLAYIGSLEANDDSQPLTAIQWYNENVDSPIYHKLIINRQNLDVILATYPDEVSSAGLLIGSSDDAVQFTQTLREPATQAMLEANILHDSGSLDDVFQQSQAFRVPATQVMEEPVSRLESPELSLPSVRAVSIVEEPVMRLESPEFSLPSPRAPSIVEIVDKEVSSHQPDTVAEMAPPPISPRTSFGERKRKYLSEGFHGHLDSTPEPSPQPAASSAGSVRSKKRRLTETPDQRSKRLKAFLEKRKEQGIRLSGFQASARRA